MGDTKKMKNIILILVVLIVVTGAVGWIYYERNIFGDDRLRFEIEASEEMEAGEVAEYTLRYTNNSDVRLEDMGLIFEYPENMKPVENEEDEEGVIRRGERRREVEVGELNPGEERVTVFEGRPFGERGDSLRAKAEMRYTPKNLTARYRSDREHMAKINEVPIDFSFEMPPTMDAGEEDGIRILFSSEVEYPLEDVEIRVDYPEGFEFLRSTPEADSDDKAWEWPILNEGDDGAIDIEGVLEGDPGEGKIFEATLGVWMDERFLPLKETSRGVSLSESDLIVDMQVNGERDYVAEPGELLHYEIFVKNVGDNTLEDLFLLADLDGEVLDLDNLEPARGRFQENRGVVIWSHAFDSGLHSLSSDEEERLEFWVETKKDDLPYHPEAEVRASIEKARDEITTKIGTILSVEKEVIREDSPFEEFGPFPLEEGEESSFTVKWDVETLFNDLRDVRIETALPDFARASGEKYPDDMDLSFDSDSGEVVIEKDDLSAGREEEVFLKVEVDLEDDLDEDLMLLEETVVSGEDRHTGEEVKGYAGGVSLGDLLEDENDEEDKE